MLDRLVGFAIGFVAWWVTGIDDFLIVLAFMMKGHTRSHTLAVSMGTLLSVILMLGISFGVGYGASISLRDYAHFFGVIPICFGLWGIFRWWKHKNSPEEVKNDLKHTAVLAYGIAPFGTYLANSSDDIILNSSLLQWSALNIWGFVCGILCGTISTIILALISVKAEKDVSIKFQRNKTLKIIFSHKGLLVDGVLIGIGILILLSVFSRG